MPSSSAIYAPAPPTKQTACNWKQPSIAMLKANAATTKIKEEQMVDKCYDAMKIVNANRLGSDLPLTQ